MNWKKNLIKRDNKKNRKYVFGKMCDNKSMFFHFARFVNDPYQMFQNVS